jgi:hypothetical protein
MRFAHATRFEDDFVQGRVPVDRKDVVVRGERARLVVLSLPEEGRPADFSGAIGRFSLSAGAEPRELASGEGLALEVVIQALDPHGDLSQASEPRLSDPGDFHVRGSLVEREAQRMLVRYDLVPRDPTVRAIPPVRFVFFDTTPPAGYRTLASEPIAITVRAQPPTPPPAAAPEAAPGAGLVWTRTRGIAAALVLLALAFVALRSLRRAR